MSPPLARRSAWARRGQLALIGAAVALSVALSVASFEFAELMGRALGTGASSPAAVLQQTPAGAVVVTARTSGVTTATALDDALVARIRAVDGVLVASGAYDQPVSFRLRASEQPERPATLRGVVFSAAFAPPWRIVSGRAPSGPNEVAVDVGGSVVGRTGEGSFAQLELPTGRRDVVVVGIATQVGDLTGAGDAAGGGSAGDRTPALSEAHVLFDPVWIGGLLGATGRVDRITVVPGPGVDRDDLARRIEGVVGAGVRVTATSDPNAVAQQTVATLDDGVQRATRIFALLTSAVAVIVVANVFAVVLAPRARELALLRTVGASRRQLLRWLLGEALIVGVLATLVGFALGVPLGAFAAGLVQTGSVEVGPTITRSMVVVAPVVGVGVTVLGALAPARRASRVPPLAALGDHGDARPSLNRAVARVIGTGIGSVAGAVAGVARIGSGRSGWVPAMASRNVRRRPAATSAAASTLLVGLVLVGGVAVAGASFRAGLADRFRTESSADLYVERRGVVRVDRGSIVFALHRAGVPLAAEADVVSVEGLLATGTATESRVVASTLDRIGDLIDLDVRSGRVGGRGTAMLSEPVARKLDARVGAPVTLRSTSGESLRLTVAGTYANTAFYGPAIVHLQDAQQIRADGTFERMALRLAPGTDVRDARWQLGWAARRFPRTRVTTPEQFAELNTAVADTVLRIVGVLLATAVAIGAVGLSATLSLGVLQRSTELSRLRAIGATRSQVQRVVTVEAVLVCVGAAVWGLGIGAVVGSYALRYAPPDLLIERVVPWWALVAAAAGATGLGALAAVVPARRAAALAPIDAARQ